jgi:protease stability complex PrcB-like protein
MVVIAALGILGSGGDDVVVDSAAATKSEYLIFVRITEPGENCPVTEGVTHPIDVVRVTRSSLPVRFIEQTVVNRC